MRSIADARVVVGPQVITRYNNCRAIPIQGSPSPGTSSGTALAARADVSKATLPAGYGYEWTGTAYQEQLASGQTGAIVALALLFVLVFVILTLASADRARRLCWCAAAIVAAVSALAPLFAQVNEDLNVSALIVKHASMS